MNSQLRFFAEAADSVPVSLGRTRIATREARSILTKASGFMAGYDFTLNPYSGCAYGCTYCYAAFFAHDEERRDAWGEWVEVKQNAVELLQRMRTDLNCKTVYMSSVTDPYQLIERRLGMVRRLLKILASRGVRLVVQTRSPLVTRDIDLLSRFEAVQVNITVTTDSEEVRKAFEPDCPPNKARLDAARTVASAGIPTVITMTPLLPVADAAGFSRDLLQVGAIRYVVQPFHAEKGRFIRGTRDAALQITSSMGWDEYSYAATVKMLREHLPGVREGQEGFVPIWLQEQ